MITIKYKTLFDLEITHPYYESGKSDDLQIMPTEACSLLLRRLGLRFLAGEYGGRVVARVHAESGLDLIQNPLAEGTKFTFVIKVRSSTFENITALNTGRPPGSRYYFNNLGNNLSALSDPLLVSNAVNKQVSDSDLMPFASNTFSVAHNSTNATLAVDLEFPDTGESYKYTAVNDNNVYNLSFDLKKFSGGRAKLLLGGIEKTAFYTINQEDNTGIFGVIEIFHRNDLPDAYRFQHEDDTVETKFYKIAFGGRATKWRYIINKRFNKSITGVKVAKSNGSAIVFITQAGAGPDQFIMVSPTPLSLQEKSLAGIALRDQNDKVIIANLPNPRTGLLNITGGEVYSDILITI